MRVRAVPEDFVVDEVPLFAPLGRGDHTLVHVEKRGVTTEQVARELARAAGAASRDVGYAGRKDRFAVARQWFSVPGLAPEVALRLELSGARVLDARRHPHKLRTGRLRANRFRLRLREVEPGQVPALSDALAALEREGLPNRYGVQRFGRDADNATRAAGLLRGGRSPRDRREARFLLSALQAAVFNEVLARRPRPLAGLLAGDVAVVHASGGLFRVEDPVREQPRADAFEISPTGPLPGARPPEAAGEPARAERDALAALGLEPELFARPPRGIRLRGARRSLRVRPEDCRLEVESEACLCLCCQLPPGSYASVLLEELAARAGVPLDG
jgi:tRNA pseudouridine13 synthase